MSEKFKVISDEIIYQDRYHVFRKMDITRDGTPGVYTYLGADNGHGLAIMAVSDKGRVPIIRQYRFPIRQEVWEICLAGIDPNEEPAETARRELAEEMGLQVDPTQIAYLGQGYWNTGLSNIMVSFFLAYIDDALLDGLKVPQDADEIVDLKVVMLDELDHMADRGELVCGATFMTLYHVKKHLEKRKADDNA